LVVWLSETVIEAVVVDVDAFATGPEGADEDVPVFTLRYNEI
jgi:hypothetical protein